ncbi:MAG TPA: hypothetical protein VFQ79_17595, partial [Bryobacteraceae bacterium]|nr:hypothetical protein [Bryobacteraceae bacterium]
MDSRSEHLPEEQLFDFREENPSRETAAHLASCPHCRQRLHDLQEACKAYEEYRTTIREPLLPPAPQTWPGLSVLIAGRKVKDRPWRFRWWPAAALAAASCLAIAVVVFYGTGESSSRRAERILAQSAQVALPEGRMISLQMQGHTLVRPAVLKMDVPAADDPEMIHLRNLFVAANYSWEEPLSARSFLAWRDGLAKRRDEVSIVHGDGRRAYRVRTENPAGKLRAASLLLREHDMRPTEGSFDFEGETTLEVAETSMQPDRVPRNQRRPEIAQPEIPAGPEDTIRVLAALRRLGADVEDPIAVVNDGRAVVVRGNGISPDRQQEIAAALHSIPRVRLDFGSAGPVLSFAPPEAASERHSTNIPFSIRRKLEDRLGGPLAAQQTIDMVLDESSSLMSHARALENVAAQFPETVEPGLSAQARKELEFLWNSHLSEMKEFLGRIREQLHSLTAAAVVTPPVAVPQDLRESRVHQL